MRTPRCEQCDQHLGARHAANARYCSGRCRTAACRARKRTTADPVPVDLTRRRQWVRHTANKVPLVAAPAGHRPRTASSTDPATWRSHQEAAESTVGVGRGFVLAEGDGIVCIDLDHAINNGTLLPWAREVIDQLPPTYIEISPSGTGLHVWGHGTVGRGRRIRRGDRCIELYDRERYITVTGRPWAGAPSTLGDLTETLSNLA
ncbi:bifunctional DNA primase/polymerase [Streptomyces hydrogenans]|uniref:bifunctional DNA primase/polymerase n=1 Tax=Streptomyces hydrogenans TaxID=1873719 RepID=UPI00367C86D1